MISVKIGKIPSVSVDIRKSDGLSVELKQVQLMSGLIDKYDGPTDVVPRLFSDVILETKDKVVPENLHILAIPYSETGNSAGGKTVTIGRGSGNG